MSIWGKVIGGAAGFALGGPPGALFGALAGHAVDRMSGDGEIKIRGGGNSQDRQIAFTVAVITLGAKMAKADGMVTRAEIDAFKEVFHIPAYELKNVSRVFDQARKDPRGFEPYASQVGNMFAHEPAVLEELLNALFHIARADGTYHPSEQEFLRKCAELFGFSPADFARMEAGHTEPDQVDPYMVLGVSREDSDSKIKANYRQFIRDNHPDKLVAEGLPQEFIDLANERMATVNDAYASIRRERGLN